jgi:hypothetical protein
MSWFRRLRGWLARLARWLFKPHMLWTFVVGTAAPVVLVLVVASEWEQRLRLAGLLFQWLGIAVVAYGLHETRKLFHRPTMLSLACDWFRQFPPWLEKKRLISGTATIQAGSSSMTGRMKVSPAPGAPLQDRVRILEEQVDRLQDLTWNLDDRAREDSKRLDSAIESERKNREAEDQQVRRLLEEVLAGGLRIEWMGVFWLFVGVMLGTVPTDIVRLFGLH